MASKTGSALASVGALTDIDTSARNPVGMRVRDDATCAEFIYLKGVASTVAGSPVTYNTSFQSALTVTGARGPVAFAMAATVANTWGWYQICGSGTGDYAGAATAGA